MTIEQKELNKQIVFERMQKNLFLTLFIFHSYTTRTFEK